MREEKKSLIYEVEAKVFLTVEGADERQSSKIMNRVLDRIQDLLCDDETLSDCVEEVMGDNVPSSFTSEKMSRFKITKI